MRGGEETNEDKIIIASSLRILINDTLKLNPQEQTDNDILLGLKFLNGEEVGNISEVMDRLWHVYQDIKQEIRGVHPKKINNKKNQENHVTKMLIASAVYSELTRVGIPSTISRRVGGPDSTSSPSKDNAEAILKTILQPNPYCKVPLAIYYLYYRDYNKSLIEKSKANSAQLNKKRQNLVFTESAM